MAITDFDTGIWGDAWFCKLPVKAKLLFIYTWTNNHKNISGVYELTTKNIINDTELSLSDIRGNMMKLHGKVYYDWDRELVFVVNHFKRQFLRVSSKVSPSILRNLHKCLHAAPKGHSYVGAFLKTYGAIMNDEGRGIIWEYPYEIEESDELGPAPPPIKSAKKLAKPWRDDEKFVKFWETFPRKDSGPQSAHAKWPSDEIEKKPELFDHIMDKLAMFMSTEQWQDPVMVPYATTWLNQRRWEADPTMGGNNGDGQKKGLAEEEPGKYGAASEKLTLGGEDG